MVELRSQLRYQERDGGVDFLLGTVRGVDTKRDLAAIEIDHGAPVLPTRIVLASDAGTPIIQMGYSVASTGGFPVVHTGVITTVIRHLGERARQCLPTS